MKIHIEGYLMLASALAGGITFLVSSSPTRVVAYLTYSIPPAILAIAAAGLLYQYVRRFEPERPKEWDIAALIGTVGRGKTGARSMRFCALAALVLITLSLGVFGFWAGFVGTYVIFKS